MPPLTSEAGKQPFVLLRRYACLSDALLCKTVLDSASIDCVLSDANIIRLDWLYTNLIGGVKLWARENEADDGFDLLDQEIPEKFEIEGLGEYTQPRCPQCRSFEVSYQELVKVATYLATFILGLPIHITRRAWKCHACGHSWPASQDPTQQPP
ncbi:MAG: hypothetical protein WCB14_12475 [Candidatus Acidiferrales bacterium]